jgi:hypothetical protein
MTRYLAAWLFLMAALYALTWVGHGALWLGERYEGRRLRRSEAELRAALDERRVLR